MLLLPNTVAVIGAGSAGLSAARHLLNVGLPVCILEASAKIGGAWSGDSKMWDGLHTNLSKHTCRFSDFEWEKTELFPGSTATFPSKTDMDRYLQSYAEEFVLNHPECQVKYNCHVSNVEMLEENSNNNNYRIKWTDTTDDSAHTQDFQSVVLATGFFNKPHLPEGFAEAIKEEDNFIIHSKDYASHETLFSDDNPSADKTVAVVGSSFSALEIAVDATRNEQVKKVVHITPKIPWVVPRFVPAGDDNAFLPVDLAFYKRQNDYDSNHHDTAEDYIATPAQNRQKHEALQKMVGARQADILGIPSNFDDPPMVAISDYYLDLVQDGTIEVVQGRASGVEGNSLVVETSQQQVRHLSSIDKIICGTGYLPNLQSILDDSILKTVEYESNLFSPLTSCWECLHPKLPKFAMVGMYRGSYMGAVELQARLVSQVLSGKLELTNTQYEEQLEISRAIRSQVPRPQFPRGNYIGFMDSMARILSICDDDNDTVSPQYNTKKGNMVVPAFYQSNADISKAAHDDLAKEMEKGQNGSHVPAIVMSALIGSWDFDRTMVHFSNNHRERVHGTIVYSRPKLDYVLYREDGLYELAPGKSLPVFREYEYVCRDDMLEIYFVEGGERAHLFLSLKFQQDQSSNGYWVATSDHLCIKDLYSGHFKIKLDGLKATELVITYRVKGPAKDYEATTYMTPTKVSDGSVLSAAAR